VALRLCAVFEDYFLVPRCRFIRPRFRIKGASRGFNCFIEALRSIDKCTISSPRSRFGRRTGFPSPFRPLCAYRGRKNREWRKNASSSLSIRSLQRRIRSLSFFSRREERQHPNVADHPGSRIPHRRSRLSNASKCLVIEP